MPLPPEQMKPFEYVAMHSTRTVSLEAGVGGGLEGGRGGSFVFKIARLLAIPHLHTPAQNICTL